MTSAKAAHPASRAEALASSNGTEGSVVQQVHVSDNIVVGGDEQAVLHILALLRGYGHRFGERSIEKGVGCTALGPSVQVIEAHAGVLVG